MEKDLFPYRFRKGQEELLKFVQEEVWNSGVCVNAATGFGKTPVILAALLPFAESHRIIWAVRTGNETDRPIEELKVINQRTGSNFFGISYRGKRDMCLLAREAEFDGELTYGDVSFLCKSKRKECRYRLNFEERFPSELLTGGPLLYSEILSLCMDREVCPFLVQRELLSFATVISLSYNYIIDEGMGWSIRREVPFEDAFLVVDEAHNLQHACSNLNSDEITLRTVDRALREVERFDISGGRRVRRLLLAIQRRMEKVMGSMGGREEEFDAEGFLESLLGRSRSREDVIEDLFRMKNYGTRVRTQQLSRGKRPRSSLFHLANFWFASLELLGTDGVAFLARKERGTLVLERWDMRAATVLRERWKEFKGCVYCSGTLIPFNAFAETAGLDGYRGKQIHSHYDPKRIVALIPRGLSTKGERLSSEMAERYVGVISDFVRSLKANLATFAASYRIQRGLLRAGLREAVEAEGRRFFQENQGMSGDEAREVLDGFKACATRGDPGFLCATATGRFAEGVDFPGRELEGIFLVGIPFERMSVRTKLYLDYYRNLYGRERGSYYAYVVPALRRASQSLGRALRSRRDRAAFVCGDERYAEKRFFRLLPDFVRGSAEVVDCRELSRKIRAWDRSTRSGGGP